MAAPGPPGSGSRCRGLATSRSASGLLEAGGAHRLLAVEVVLDALRLFAAETEDDPGLEVERDPAPLTRAAPVAVLEHHALRHLPGGVDLEALVGPGVLEALERALHRRPALRVLRLRPPLGRDRHRVGPEQIPHESPVRMVPGIR